MKSILFKFKTGSVKKNTILIVDDHQLIRQAWSSFLNSHSRYRVVGECQDAKEAIQVSQALLPEIIILDINLPDMSGVDAVEHLHHSSPSSKILGISMHNHPAYARKMIKNGAMGYLCKNSSAKELFLALDEIMNGRKYLCEDIKEILMRQVIYDDEVNTFKSLSERELGIIQLIKEGLSSKEIAAQLFLSVKTVEVHRYNILKKLKLRNSAALVNFINSNDPL
jgi:DNA-binding NarL/FixJ family response regulator